MEGQYTVSRALILPQCRSWIAIVYLNSEGCGLGRVIGVRVKGCQGKGGCWDKG